MLTEGASYFLKVIHIVVIIKKFVFDFFRKEKKKGKFVFL